MSTTLSPNRYARDWNGYSEHWDRSYGRQYAHLGDEWNDDGTSERARDELYFAVYAKRWLKPDMTVLEVGPGGGKWTVRIAPFVKKVIVLDVAAEMLRRTRERCESLGIRNVEYIDASGTDFRPVADQSVDLFFSYDVFVHIALEDTFPYVLADHAVAREVQVHRGAHQAGAVRHGDEARIARRADEEARRAPRGLEPARGESGHHELAPARGELGDHAVARGARVAALDAELREDRVGDARALRLDDEMVARRRPGDELRRAPRLDRLAPARQEQHAGRRQLVELGQRAQLACRKTHALGEALGGEERAQARFARKPDALLHRHALEAREVPGEADEQQPADREAQRPAHAGLRGAQRAL
jgi:hypothetical protein